MICSVPYHKEVVGGLQRPSCLAVVSRGLGTQEVLLESVRRTLESGGVDSLHSTRLAFLLNTSQDETEMMFRRVAEDPEWDRWRHRFVTIRPDMSVDERSLAYAHGGVFVVNARLLVPDLLTGRVLPETLDGLFVNHAHTVSEFSAEAFVLLLYRGSNSRGFLRVVTDRADLLHVDLFREYVQEAKLSQWTPEAHIEPRSLLLELPPRVQKIQQLLAILIEGTFQELRNCKSLNLEHVDAQAFDVQGVLRAQRQMLGPRTVKVMRDLQSVRKLLANVLRCDAVRFYTRLEEVAQDSQTPVWCFSADAETLFSEAQARIYEVVSGGSEPTDASHGLHSDSEAGLHRTLEPHRKWQVLLDLIAKTVSDVARKGPSPSSSRQNETEGEAQDPILEPRVLVMVPNEWTKVQVSSVMQRGVQGTLLDSLHAHLQKQVCPPSTDVKQSRAPAHRHGNSSGPLCLSPTMRHLWGRELVAVTKELQDFVHQSVLQLVSLPGDVLCHPRVDVIALNGPEGTLGQQLRETNPHAVVLYEPSLEGLRAVEAFCASRAVRAPDVELVPPEVHVLLFDDAAEKDLLAHEVAVELEAMRLVRRKWDEQTVEAVRPTKKVRRTLGDMLLNKIVVDMREFRSALPLMLHKRDFVVEPVTIPIGDYVLSTDICVERKAIPDLVQSLASGRLYQQAQNLCHHYASAVLLIEFDPEKTFALLNSFTVAQREVNVGARDLLGKLVLVVLHFPRLRFVWSPSFTFTSNIFVQLKEGKKQPDPHEAAHVGSDSGDGSVTSTALDVLRKMPGVTPKTVRALARCAGSLTGLVEMSEDAVADVLGKAGASALCKFLHATAIPSPELGPTE